MTATSIEPEPGTVTSPDGTRISYDRYGHGPTVIFIGGASQCRALNPGITAAARDLAAHGWTTVDYDRRGRGQSGDTAPWTLDKEVEDLAALVEAVGGPAALCSSSSGAALALGAAQAGVGVSALALYEPPFFAGVDLTQHLTHLRALLGRGEYDAAQRYQLTDVVGLPGHVVEAMAQAPWWPGMVALAPTVLYDLTAVNTVNLDPDWHRRWRDVTVPVVVYSGAQTFPGLAAAADAVAAAIADAGRQVLPGQDHGITAQGLVPALAPFLGQATRTSPW